MLTDSRRCAVIGGDQPGTSAGHPSTKWDVPEADGTSRDGACWVADLKVGGSSPLGHATPSGRWWSGLRAPWIFAALLSLCAACSLFPPAVHCRAVPELECREAADRTVRLLSPEGPAIREVTVDSEGVPSCEELGCSFVAVVVVWFVDDPAPVLAVAIRERDGGPMEVELVNQ
jgi:hypothetical protein